MDPTDDETGDATDHPGGDSTTSTATDIGGDATAAPSSGISRLPRWGWLLCAVVGVGLAVASIRLPEVTELPPGQAVHVVGDMVKVGRSGRVFSHIALDGYLGKNPAWDGEAITLAGARGETVAFQILVRAGDTPLPDVDARPGALVAEGSRLGNRHFTRFRQWYTEVTSPSESPGGSTGPGWYPDALIPAEVPGHGLPVTVPPGQVQGIWLDLEIPRDAAPGSYRGHIAVTSGATELARLAIRLEVHDVALPVQRHLPFRVGYGGFGSFLAEHENIGYDASCGEESEQFRAREAQLHRLARAHGLTATTHYSSPIPRSSGSGAALQIDWATFDRRFAPYLDGSAFDDGVPVEIFSLPVNLQSHGGWPTGTGARTRTVADVDTAALEAAVKQTVDHWRQRGWPLDRSFIYLADEPPPERWPILDAACAAIRRASPEVPVSVAFYTAFGERGAEIVERFQGCVTRWEVAGDFMNTPALDGRRGTGDTIGFYQGSEPFQGSEALDADGTSLVTWPWIAWRYQLDSLFLYNMVEWHYQRLDDSDKPWRDLPRDIWSNPLNQSWQTNSQGVLVYPGHTIGYPGVVPSIRLKQIRRGMQDHAYLWMAREAGQGDLSDRIARRIIPRALNEAAAGFGESYRRPGTWERDPRKWHQARQELAAALSGSP